jgi:hypothetical protein|nr:MAG TPA: hypothetical protein [Caudoviricetes sp.]
MLVKNDKEWCWCLCEHVGYPQKSIEDAVKDFNEFNETYQYVEPQLVRVGNPYYYVPTVDAERVINDIIDYDLDDEIAEYSEDYLLHVELKQIDVLQEKLTKAFREWEEQNGYKNTSFVIFETINPFENKE